LTKKAALPAVLVLVALSTIAPPVSAQSAAQLAGGPLPPQYVLDEYGTLTYEGDVIISCPGFVWVSERYRGKPSSPRGREIRSALAECERAGFSLTEGVPVRAAFPPRPSNSVSVGDTGIGEVTEDGFVRTSPNTFVACRSGFSSIEWYAEACSAAGFPGKHSGSGGEGSGVSTLPDTGGGRALLIATGLLLVGAGLIVLRSLR
jgi:hypothetical protein